MAPRNAPTAKSPDGLNLRQRKFVLFYVETGQGMEAALRAGYGKTMAQHFSRELLALPAVAAAVSIAEARIMREIDIDTKRVLQETGRIAFFDPRELFRHDGTFKPPGEWPTHIAAGISSIKVREWTSGAENSEVHTTIREVKFWNKDAALERLMKHLGLLGDGGEAPEPVTVDQADRAAKVREHFAAFLDELAVRGAPPPPQLPVIARSPSAPKPNGNGSANGANGHG